MVEVGCRYIGKRPKASTKYVSGMKNMIHEEKLKWFSLENGRLIGEKIVCE